ncbi:MAG: DNA translocase FtsK 4TM domain-containing protein [bacterium]|nr:DNA translocase FtsK 4TM domain-containing protein [bacterium]
MSKDSKKQKRPRREKEERDYDETEEELPEPQSLSHETIYHAVAIALAGTAAFLLLAALGKAGPVGDSTYRLLSHFLGVGYYLIPLGAIGVATAFFRTTQAALTPLRLVGAFVFFLAGLALIELLAETRGGVVGGLFARTLSQLFERLASIVLLVALIAITLLVLFDTHLPTGRIAALVRAIKERKKKGESSSEDSYTVSGLDAEHLKSSEGEGALSEKRSPITGSSSDPSITPSSPPASPEGEGAKTSTEAESTAPGKQGAPRPASIPRRREAAPTEPDIELRTLVATGRYIPPPVSLLEGDRGKPGVGDIKANTNIIKRTLSNFGITVEIEEVSIGPTVTRYALKPAEGVKLSRIVGLKNELSLALAAHPIRIEAPIPGKSQVGIELPNTAKTTVGLAHLVDTEEFSNSDKPLLVVLGKSITGKAHYASLTKMPHLLIAGATGSGKSVAIHALVTSLLYRNAPEHLRIILIDPKRVELTLYNTIPHLLTPVVTNARQAILSLRWAAKEMDRRYDVLEAEKVRDIESYHKNIVAPAYAGAAEVDAASEESVGIPDTPALPERMPYIAIVIDELADIMAAYPRELEAAIVRLAQMSRAVGIHLVLSTQRPSVNVITGLIKANIPTRIAFQVASQIDSRTILDSGGAETLLGAGDMLYLAGDMAKPQRLQSAFISETEVKKVVGHVAANYDALPPEHIVLTSENADSYGSVALPLDEDGGDDDLLYEQAREVVMRADKASTSLLQRRLRVGYARAARLVDMLEERGVVGPADGSKPRDILVREGNESADERERGEV